MNKLLLLAGVAMLTNGALDATCSSCGYQYYQGRHSNYNQHSSINKDVFRGQSDRYITERDKEILLGIQENIKNYNFDTQNNTVNFVVEYGKVVAIGRVNSENEREIVYESISSTPYVRSVVMDVYVHDFQNRQ